MATSGSRSGRGQGGGPLLGATLLAVAHAFASGGAAVTGVEVISNGVPAFKSPAWRNARRALATTGTGRGVMFLDLSFLASQVEVAPYDVGTPTVIAQIGEAVDGHGALGAVLFYSLRAGTMLILVPAADTGVADFRRAPGPTQPGPGGAFRRPPSRPGGSGVTGAGAVVGRMSARRPRGDDQHAATIDHELGDVPCRSDVVCDVRPRY